MSAGDRVTPAPPPPRPVVAHRLNATADMLDGIADAIETATTPRLRAALVRAVRAHAAEARERADHAIDAARGRRVAAVGREQT